MQRVRPPSTGIPGFLRNHAVTWLVALIGLTLSIIGFEVVREQINVQRKIEFNWVAQNRNRLLKQVFENALEPVRVVRDYVQASEEVEKEAFHLFTSPLLHRNHGIEAIGLIDHEPSNSIKSVDDQRFLLPILINEDLSLTHIESRGSSDFVSLHDVTTQRILLAALQKARDTGEMAVSGRLKLSGQSGGNYGVMACLPVYQPGQDKAKTPLFKGLVIAVLRLDELTHAAISYLEPRGVDLVIEDDSADEQTRFLEFYTSRLNPKASFPESLVQEWLATAATKLTEVVRMADRKWSITTVPNAYFRSTEAFEEGPWVVLSGGCLLTLLLGVYLVRMKLNMEERLTMGCELRDRETLFWQMTETVDDVFWALPADRGRFLYVSPAFESIWGIDCQALYEQPKLFANAIHPDDRIRWAHALDKANSGTGPVESIYRLIRPDGTQRWIRDNAFPVRDEFQHIYRLVGVAEDITEKKQAEDALRDSEHKLRTLFNQSPDTIMTVDRTGQILLINRGAVLEPSGSRGVGMHSSDLLPAASREEYRHLLSKVFQNCEVNYLQYQKKDSTWWEIRIVPIVQQQAVQACMVIATDITEKRNYQAQAIRNARLASIGVLSTGVAHEINNPNNAIQTGTALFAHVWKDAMPVLREYYQEQGDFSLGGLSFAEQGDSLGDLISEIKNNSHRIKTIVDNLKHLGKKGPGDLDEEVDINAAIKGAIGVLGSSIRKYTHHWVVELAEDLPPVRGNIQQLEQVFINVMLNALQSLPNKGCGIRVKLAADTENQSLLIRVEDQGSGIADEDLPRVTEPFFTTRLQVGGTGLGLSISRTIIENHRGSISFESSMGAGTVVILRLPVIEGDDTHET